jgi:carboxyl-terminal processing protease
MRRAIKIPLLIAAGLVAAIMLVGGGFLLGVRDDVGSAVRGLFPAVAGSTATSGDSYQLQQEVLDKLKNEFYKPVDDAILHADAIDGMVAGLNDPYTEYWDPEEYAAYKQGTSGAFTGVGMVLQMEDGRPTTVSTIKGGPAAEAGVLPGDVIVAVDGESVDGMTLKDVVARVKGDEGTNVELELYRPPAAATTSTTVGETGGAVDTSSTTSTEPPKADLSNLPPGGESKKYTLTRRTLEVPVTETTILEAGDRKVALISLSDFYQGSAAALRAAVTRAIEVDKVDAVALDLRDNPGGFLDQGVDVASVFIPKGDIVSTEGIHEARKVWTASGDAYADVPLYLLTNSHTASASEIVAGALQDYRRATLVGETTFGKGVVQSIMPLSNGGALKATTALYYTPNGRNINDIGIVPDVVAPDDPKTTAIDETVRAVLQLVAKRFGTSLSTSGTSTSTTSTSTTSTSTTSTTTVPSTTR